MPTLKKGDDFRERFAVAVEAINEANRRIDAGAGWYQGVVLDYAAGR